MTKRRIAGGPSGDDDDKPKDDDEPEDAGDDEPEDDEPEDAGAAEVYVRRVVIGVLGMIEAAYAQVRTTHSVLYTGDESETDMQNAEENAARLIAAQKGILAKLVGSAQKGIASFAQGLGLVAGSDASDALRAVRDW